MRRVGALLAMEVDRRVARVVRRIPVLGLLVPRAKALDRRPRLDQRAVHCEVLVAHQARSARLVHDGDEERAGHIVLQQAVPVPRKRAVVEARLVRVFNILLQRDGPAGRRGRDRARRAPAAEPGDPRTMAPGESVVMSEAFYNGHNLQVSYRPLQATMGFEEGQRLSTGAQGIDARTMRIYVSDEEFVRQALSLGLSVTSRSQSGRLVPPATSRQT